MSNIYIQEPPTIGKVLLKTTVGDIDIELWSKETPKACRNFIQLCLEGYYNNTIFHRVVKGFIVQGGDPTGTGTGGESIYGQPFKDEFHTRLRFNRRGLVAMANAGKDDNGSQFFFTFAAAPELQNKHTIFGKVTGETIYNMLKLEEALVDEDERPLYPQKIFKAEVLNNPFPDIVPRRDPAKEQVTEVKKKEKSAGVKNFKLLSFGEEAEEDEEENEVANKMYAGRSKSTHDVLNDPKLSAVPAVDMNQKTKKNKNEVRSENDEDNSNASASEESALSGDEDVSKRGWNSDEEKKETENIRKKLKTEYSKTDQSHKKTVPDAKESESEGEDYYLGQEQDKERKRKMEQIRKEIKDLKREMKNDKQNKETEIKLLAAEKKEKEILKEYNETVAKYKQKKQEMPKKGQSREEFTLSLLSKFQKKLAEAKDKAQNSADQGDDKKDDDSNADSESEEWLTHKLQFEEKLPVLAKDASTKDDDWFEIYDPRNPINKRRRETSKNAMKNKEKQ
ncbi:spliceosome-associated protein CWC27 homolog [Schistocerca americana]|uniref:spliceosome-associated protein CWC27 homolog n=1 Tax=Schistocerca americana TaxID=7009 RepID=UPI001F4FE802|nr:spliceosome-associated protein CWC27 homolog [Schistocerca americana]XP_049964125.1 spliceosome-associated protein CWC27 homolog isoform X2 [Schistocerca serialis cubense]